MSVTRNRPASRAEVALCPIHAAVREACLVRLRTDGYFSMQDALNDTHIAVPTDSIRWDYLRQGIEAESGIELIPLAAPFFSRQRPKAGVISRDERKRFAKNAVPEAEQRQILAKRFIALGNGKRTVGYASVVQQNGDIAIVHMRQREAITNGTRAASERFAATVTGAVGALPGPESGQRMLDAPTPVTQ